MTAADKVLLLTGKMASLPILAIKGSRPILFLQKPGKAYNIVFNKPPSARTAAPFVADASGLDR